MKRLLTAATLLIATLAAVVAQPAQQSPGEQVLSARLLQEINTSLQCGTALLSLQQQVADLQKKLKEADAKQAPAKK